MRANTILKEHFKQMELFDSELKALLNKWNAEIKIELNADTLEIEVKAQNKLNGKLITWLPVSACISLS